MNIRRANIEDIPQLAALFDAYRVFYEKASDIEQAEFFLSERIHKNESVIFVAENEAHMLTGFVQLYPLFSSTHMKRFWLLNDLYVAPEQRGKGISVALIDAAKELCSISGSCGMMLETAKSNLIGNNLYPKTGFELDEAHNYYSWDI
jgi:ribosomal protein S18 acetylase RimI-like enzyme